MSTGPNECSYCGMDHGSDEPCEALDGKAAVAGLAYWVGLQDDEPSYTSTCGCVLTRDGSSFDPDACDIAIFVCPTHEHAEELRQKVEQLVTWFDGVEDGNGMARIHSGELDALRAILAKP